MISRRISITVSAYYFGRVAYKARLEFKSDHIIMNLGDLCVRIVRTFNGFVTSPDDSVQDKKYV